MKTHFSHHPPHPSWTKLHPAHARRYGIGLLATLACLLAAFLLRPALTHAAVRLTAPDPVTAAWQKAKAAGSYHFTSNVSQKTIPVASITNVGRTSRTEQLRLEGQNDLRAQKLALTLWSQGGSVLHAESGISIRTERGKTFTRHGNAAWEEVDNMTDGFVPQGDFLGYLAAIHHVTSGVAETRNGIHFTRYSFEIDGLAFANYLHEQLVTAMRAKGELPPSVQLEAPAYYRDMTGQGELWVDENGLPLRQVLALRFPEQKAERVEAAITVDFSKYGAERGPFGRGLSTLLRAGAWRGAWLVLPQRAPDLTGLWLALTVSALAFLGIVYRRKRMVQIAIISAVIFSQVAGPLLSTFTQVKFFDAQSAKAATQQEQQTTTQREHDLRAALTTAPQFKPHQNPL